MKQNWHVKALLAPVRTALIIALVAALFRGYLAAEEAAQKLVILSDAFYLAGILLVSFFLLGAINREGPFDMVAYNLKLMLPMRSKQYDEHLQKDPYAYMEDKRSQRQKKDKGYPTLVVGLLCLLLAWLFLVLYRNAG